MPVKQLDAPCWKPCSPGERPDGREGPHWLTAAQSADHAGPGEIPVPFPSRCWEVACDGLDGESCGVLLEDEDECWTAHLETPDETWREWWFAEGWEVSDDGQVRCPECVSEALVASHV